MKIAIIGIGKMGAWLAKTLSVNHDVAVYDRNPGKASGLGKVAVLESVKGLSTFAPDMLINAVSLQNTIPAFDECVLHLPAGCVICDVASVKAGLRGYYAACGFKFASVHPMFGPTFANMESLEGENAVVIRESDATTADFFRRFFSALGARVYDYGFDEHDRMMAYSLTTPFVSSLVFASCVDGTTVPGSTFSKHMKIAQGLLSEDDSLLCEILFNPQSVPQIERITSRLEHLKHIIIGRDYEEAENFLAKLRQRIR
ncbi:MAG: prephenate dehydrogenase/arogenate dehydrogenase family protein [Candidatus Micrarchaeota archaeon]|nr:prephenate dehydrogenase/arogenate dehydrogenase family protein [Candidatus Micrarchaeota archaeon]